MENFSRPIARQILILGAIFILFLTTLFFFWPGVMRPDSLSQYAQVVSGVFTDHHPPMMAFYWRALNGIIPGPGLILFTHLTLLWGAAALFACAFKEKRWAWLFVFIPIMPQVIGYAPFILKDASFALSFLCVSGILTRATLRDESLSLGLALACLVLLFYGTSVKFQAIYVLPIMLLWLVFLVMQKRWALRVFLITFALYGALWGGIRAFHAALPMTKSHSWQYVKLFDLVAISLSLEKPQLPSFVLKNSAYSWEKLKKSFEPAHIDNLIFSDQPLLIKGETEMQRQELLSLWKQTVVHYPWEYLKHRLSILRNLLTTSPLKSIDEIVSHRENVPQLLRTLLVIAQKVGVLTLIKAFTIFALYLPFLILYLVVGFLMIKRTSYALPLIMMNGMGVLLLGVLTFFSMASDVRYIYLATCFLHFSHPLFFMTWKELKKRINIPEPMTSYVP